MAAPVPHRAPLSFGDRRVLSSVRGVQGGGLPGTARRGLKYRTATEAALKPEPPAAHRVGWVLSRCTRWRT